MEKMIQVGTGGLRDIKETGGDLAIRWKIKIYKDHDPLSLSFNLFLLFMYLFMTPQLPFLVSRTWHSYTH
jgi:hypothetical protein